MGNKQLGGNVNMRSLGKSLLMMASLVLLGSNVAMASPNGSPWMPVFRFYTPGHHFQTLDYNEGVHAGFAYEGISFYVLPQALPGTVPLYRCIVPNSMDHFVSADSNCENQRTEGLYGYVFQQMNWWAQTGLYRCHLNGDHLTTSNANECYAAHLQVEGLQGFAP